MNIFTAGIPEICSEHVKEFKKHFKEDLCIENNFEQIIAYAKLGKLTKLCIYMDVWNCYGRTHNGMRGQGAAEKIHEIDPSIPILIWDGREYDPIPELKDALPCFQVIGKIHPIKNKNELYLSFDDYSTDEIKKITIDFFENNLDENKLPKKECLSNSVFKS